MGELRIAMKPQLWLWILNVFIQPPLALMFAWLAMDSTAGIGTRVLMFSLGAFCALLFVFALLVLSRTLGRTFEIVVGERELRVPNVVRGITEEVRLASITKAVINETPTATTTFFMLRIEASDRKPMVIASQLVGPDAFHQMVDALRARGVPIA